MRSEEFLNSMLQGIVPTPSDIDQLIAEVPLEDQHLDYKSGKLTTKKEDAAAIVREWVTAFANSEGGVLVLGVSERDASGARAVDGCQRIGGKPLDVWASDLLIELASFFSPQPRFHEIQHGRGPVLVVAVARSPMLVPWIESRRLRYSLRLHDKTLEVPPYLLSDLVLGRRSHPVLDVSVVECLALFPEWQGLSGALAELRFMLEIENLSMYTAEDLRVGVVGWSVERIDPDRKPRRMGHLISHLELLEPAIALKIGSRSERFPFNLVHAFNAPDTVLSVRPFETERMRPNGRFVLPMSNTSNARCRLALYLKPKNSPPSWFTVDIKYGGSFQQAFHKASTIVVERVVVQRPEVSVTIG